jgi:hypothetical protein
MQQAKHIAIRFALLLTCSGAGSALAQTAPVAPVRPLTTPASGDAHSAAMTDIDHLLLLARELKADVDKTRRDELSIQVIRDADEIEKLARSTKARIH